MSIAARSLFWVVSIGTLSYGLFVFVKPDDELLKKFYSESKHTDARKATHQTIAILKEATIPNSEINKKVEELLKKAK